MADERYIALGNMAEGLAGALQKKADAKHAEESERNKMIANMVSKGIESGTIKDPNAAFQFLIGGGKTSKKPKELPPMLKQLIGSTKHLFGGDKGPSEADQVAGRMASAQKPQGQTQTPGTQVGGAEGIQFMSPAEQDAADLAQKKKINEQITQPNAEAAGRRKVAEIEATNKAKYGEGTFIGQVRTALDAAEEKKGSALTKEEQLKIVNDVRDTWQASGKKPSDYKSFENTWLEDAAANGPLTAGQKKAEMLKARKAWSLQESSADKLTRAKSLAKYKNELEASTPDDIKDLSQSVTIGDKTTGYLDLSAIAGTKEKNAASRAAIKQGIIPVTGKQAEMLEGAGAASGNLKDFMGVIEEKLPKDAAGRITTGGKNKLSQYFQTDADLGAAMSWDVTVLPLLRAMQVSGRITNLEFQTALNARPKITDDVDTARKKVTDLNGILNRSASQVLTRGQGGSGAKPGATAAEVPEGVSTALKGKPKGHYKLRNGSEWDVDDKGNITPGTKKAA